MCSDPRPEERPEGRPEGRPEEPRRGNSYTFFFHVRVSPTASNPPFGRAFGPQRRLFRAKHRMSIGFHKQA